MSTIMCSVIACFAIRLALATDADVVVGILVIAATFREATTTHSANVRTMAIQQEAAITGAKIERQGNPYCGVTCAGRKSMRDCKYAASICEYDLIAEGVHMGSTKHRIIDVLATSNPLNVPPGIEACCDPLRWPSGPAGNDKTSRRVARGSLPMLQGSDSSSPAHRGEWTMGKTRDG